MTSGPFLGALSLLLLSSCSDFLRSCTEAGCASGVSISVRTAAGAWPDGAYALTIHQEGTTHTCTFDMPEALPDSNGLSQVTCEPPLGFPGASVHPDVTCEEQVGAGFVSQTCMPIPGRYTLGALLTTTPDAVAITVTRDGITLVDQDVAPSYEVNRPNGEGCEPACRNASVEVILR